jgi:septal ring factor EnvC (AmiA/AmiB activator)
VKRASAGLAAFLLLAPAVPLAAQDPGRARTEAQARRAADRLTALHREADQLARDARSLLGDLRALEVNRQIAAEQLRQVTAALAAASAELAALDTDMRRLESEDRAELPELRRRLVELYKLGHGGYARLLLATADLRQLNQAARTVAMLVRTDRERVEARRQRLEQLQTTRAALEQRTEELSALRTKAERAQAAATQAVARQNGLLTEIDRRRDLTAQLAGELQVAQASLQRALTAASAGAIARPPTLPLGPFRGDLDWPAAGAVRRRFGSRPLRPSAAPVTNGIEIAAPEGTPVRTIHDGTVAFAEPFTGFGNLVIVQHDDRNTSLYGYLLDIDVARGDLVGRGGTIGAVGASPHGIAGLYFELRIDAQPVDPLQWLRRR